MGNRTKPRGWLFVLPWMIGLLIFTLYPFAASLYYSFTDYSVLTPAVPNNFENYYELIEDRNFISALLNTLLYASMAIPSGLLVGLGLAKVLNGSVPGTSIYRSFIYIPHLVPTVASTILWLWILNPDQGLINMMLQPVLDIWEWDAPTFMKDDGLIGLDFEKRKVIFGALPSLVLMSVWGVGQMAIIYLAKLQEVPRDLYEAAEIDGANAWTIFWQIELPQLSPIILFNVIMGIIWAFQIFTEPYIMTGGTGGPNNATYMLPMFIYQNAFEFLRMGYACAAAWILFGLIALLTLVAFRIGQRKVHYA